jgi:hypothetical protein
MRSVAVVVLLLSFPSFAADYTPWPDRPAQPATRLTWGKQTQYASSCCKRCTKEQPCGDTCISTKK